ncbi:MAG: NADH-quinone oxidoreductase subunit M [Planctomycetota bacterium]|nr:NADH-quinone oxidoreductase subunit M [Planctomycetota bacterium]
MNDALALPILLLLPAFGALAVMLVPASWTRALRIVAVISTFATFGYTILLALQVGWDGAFYLTYDVPLIAAANNFKVDFALGVDGLGMLMVLLNGLLFAVATVVSLNINKRVREYFAMFLLLELAVFGVFIATDLFLFYVFWELILIPMFLIIGVWGGSNRQYAALKFILFTLAGSLFMLVGVIGFYLEGGSFDLIEPASIPLNAQIMLFWFVFVGLAVKVPIFPLHSWLPDAHTEAPTAGSSEMVSAACLCSKWARTVFFAYSFRCFPTQRSCFPPFLAALGVINIVYGAFLALAQKDIKRMIAASSISHMGFVILAIAALSELGFAGGTLQMLNHGIITGALFLLVGVLYDRTKKRGLSDFGGLYTVMPFYFGMMLLVTLASIGLPGLNGFVSEITCLLAGFKGYDGARTFQILAAIGASGVVLGAVYMLRLIQKVFSGPVNPRWGDLPDMNAREALSVLPLCFLIIFLGVAPGTVFNLMAGTMKALAALFR